MDPEQYFNYHLNSEHVRDCNIYGVAVCGPPVWCSCVHDVYFEGLCAGKASVYLSKRINSSLLTKIFND